VGVSRISEYANSFVVFELMIDVGFSGIYATGDPNHPSTAKFVSVTTQGVFEWSPTFAVKLRPNPVSPIPYYPSARIEFTGKVVIFCPRGPLGVHLERFIAFSISATTIASYAMSAGAAAKKAGAVLVTWRIAPAEYASASLIPEPHNCSHWARHLGTFA
jgi:hypothetical protein